MHTYITHITYIKHIHTFIHTYIHIYIIHTYITYILAYIAYITYITYIEAYITLHYITSHYITLQNIHNTTHITRPRLARKQNIASEVGPTLQDAFFFPTLREASARQHQARCSAQTGRCKLVCASCSTQVALCKLLCASCSAQVAPASWSLQVALCKLRSLQVALCKLLCASCSVQVALRKLLCASCSRQGALRKLVGASWSAQVALASCCKMQVASCDARPRTREESNPRPAGSGSRRANHETTPEDQFEQQKSQKTLSFCTLTTPIPAAPQKSKKLWVFAPRPRRSPQRVARAGKKSQKKPWVFAPRPRRFPQRVARAPQKSQKTMGFCTSTTPIPAEGRASR